ncbi:hypothetical protein DID88_008855 [Monilinia fructigena]|uniref:Uncharacterized protein n=1 Tax=Monilinia fructigena TaxID=38457 RepID=A0A395J923_9HELO|nr:hypothetical protein DID88_008855 [Monilinia fructigena]
MSSPPIVAEPTVTKPTVTKPAIAEPTVAEPNVIDPTVADPTVYPSTVLRPSYDSPAWLHFSPEDFIPILPQRPPSNGYPSLPPNSRTWVPAYLPRYTSWSHILWINIIGFVQDIHCMMLLGEYSNNITINESTFNIGFLNFAVSLQRTCQLRGAFVPGRRLVEAAWVARMSTYAIREYSASVMEHLNECCGRPSVTRSTNIGWEWVIDTLVSTLRAISMV